ncbi:MAG TPA: zinc ribbon domain-containing protein, partial [Oscillatoriaceae cyanobacterium]
QAAIIDALTGDNRNIARRPTSEHTGGMLCGLVWCEACARKMFTDRSGRRSAYRCQERGLIGARQFHFTLEASELDRLIVAELLVKLEAGLIGGIVGRLEHEQKQARAVVNLSEAGRRAIDRQIAGLARALADPDLTDAARKVVLVQMDKAARELEALEKRSPDAPHVAADLDAYRAMRDDAGFLDGVRATWDDEPLTWRRRFVRRFVERVRIRQRENGRFAVEVAFRDGSTSPFALATKHARRAKPEELELARALWESPARPARGGYAWMEAELAKAGYSRTHDGIKRLVAIVTGRPWATRKGDRENG